MNLSNDRINWITVGEVFRLTTKPVASYTDQIVKKLHSELLGRLNGRCINALVCQKEKVHKNLCSSCNQWYKELAKCHRNGDKRQIKWHENCDTSKWPSDRWEVAKFFMPKLGHNKGTVNDAKSTDLSSLLNVLEWMNDKCFLPGTRVDLDLVRKLRSVRNLCAHSANYELTDAVRKDAFDTVNKILAELVIVFSCEEVKKCIEDIKSVQTDGITNVFKAELNALNLLREVFVADLSQMKGEINQLTEIQISDRQIIEKELKNLENRISHLEISNAQETERRAQLKNCIPDKPFMFIGRDDEVNEIISSLVGKGCGIVSIVGGPGFGKSTIAVEVSHHLCDHHDIIVIFSYLSNVSNVSDVFLRLCQDVGVNPGEDSEVSFMLWLSKIKERVVLVMDNIEQLLEEKERSKFTELVSTLPKNSRQQLKILATTRTAFSIPNQPTNSIQVGELGENSSVELLRKCCPNNEVKDSYLCELANLCGFIPLALCITGSIIPRLDDPAELIQWLKEKPMEVLQSTETAQCVRTAIEISFEMLSNEDKKAFARLAVFNGNFQRKSAQEAIERGGLETQHFLKQLVDRSLIQSSSDNRFVIHSLIRRFLSDHDQLKDEKAIAQGLMVKHFLELCHSLTMKSYSKDGFTDARKLLKKDAHNVEEILKICCQNLQQKSPAESLNKNVIESLARSGIYNSSSRFFYNIGWDLLPPTVLRNFHESCMKLAENREQVAIQITFQCLVADEEGYKSAWKSDEYIDRMEAIKKAIDRNATALKEDSSLYSYCYYFYARYYSKQPENQPYPDLSEDDLTPLSKSKARNPTDNAQVALILNRRAELNKIRAAKDKEKCEEYINNAKSLYNQALSFAKESLGDHELTSICHKLLGDLHIKNEEALLYYSDAIKLRKKLQLDCNEPFVYLLKNYGSCLFYCGRFEESVETLHEAQSLAEKIGDKRPCTANVYFALARTLRSWKPDSQEAAKYAKASMEMKNLLAPHHAEEIHIFEAAEENMASSIIHGN